MHMNSKEKMFMLSQQVFVDDFDSFVLKKKKK